MCAQNRLDDELIGYRFRWSRDHEFASFFSVVEHAFTDERSDRFFDELAIVLGKSFADIVDLGPSLVDETVIDGCTDIKRGAELRCGLLFLLDKAVASFLLYRIGQLSTDQNKEPAQPDPRQKQWNGGKRTVDRIVFCDTNLHGDIEILGDEPETASHKGTDHRRDAAGFGIGKENVYDINGHRQEKYRNTL